MQILIVEDELKFYHMYKPKFLDLCYDPIHAPTGEDALTFVRTHPIPIDGAIVDLMLGDAEYGGIRFLRECRNEGFHFPVLIVTNLPVDTARDQVRRQFGGSPFDYADDYLQKRVGTDWVWEVHDRLQKLITPRRILNFPPYKYDIREKLFYRENTGIGLGPKVRSVLEHLMLKEGQYVSAAKLYSIAHDDEDDIHGATVFHPPDLFDTAGAADPDDQRSQRQRNLVEQVIKTLRQKLGTYPDPETSIPRIPIEHMRTVGYRFHVQSPVPQSSKQPQLVVGPYHLDPRYNTVIVTGHRSKTIDLPEEEFRILELLVRWPGTLRSRAWLHERLYGAASMIPLNELDARILSLARKLTDAERTPITCSHGYCRFSISAAPTLY